MEKWVDYRSTSCLFRGFFYPFEAAQTFALLWRDYHLKQRIKPRSGNAHPYAFTNREGQPYSHRMFRKAHKLAVERIGLKYEKLYGTTPHGHRHAYGQRLAKAGATPIQIKSALHHASIASSETYTTDRHGYTRWTSRTGSRTFVETFKHK